MPYKDKATRNKRCHPQREATCPICNLDHTTHGQTGRFSTVCGACYPLFRRAELVLASIQYRCKKFGIPYDLDSKWLYDKFALGVCPRTGVPYNFDNQAPSMKDRAFDGPSVDKIDPDGGYLKSNCQVVIWWYNCMKQRFTDSQVRELCQKVCNINV